MSEPDDELSELRDALAEQLSAVGLVEVSTVCRSAHKLILRDRATGVFVRVLVCRQYDGDPPFVNIMPIVSEGFDRVNIDESKTFRGVIPGSDLAAIVQQAEASLKTAIRTHAGFSP